MTRKRAIDVSRSDTICIDDPERVGLNPTRSRDWFGSLIVLVLFTGMAISAVNLVGLSLVLGNEWIPLLFTPFLWWVVLGEVMVARSRDLQGARQLFQAEPELCRLLVALEQHFQADAGQLGLSRVALRFGRDGGHCVVWRRFGHVVLLDVGLLTELVRVRGPAEAVQPARAVALHELAHIWAGDVWSLGLAQTSFGLAGPVILINAVVITPRFLLVLPLFAIATWLFAYIARRRESHADAVAAFSQGDPRYLAQALAGLNSGLVAHGIMAPLQRGFARHASPQSPTPSLAERLASAWAQHFSPARRAQIVHGDHNFFLRFGAEDMFAFGVATALLPCMGVALVCIPPHAFPGTFLSAGLQAIALFATLAAPLLMFTFMRLLSNCLVLSGDIAIGVRWMMAANLRGLLFATALVVPVALVGARGTEALLLVPIFLLAITKFALMPTAFLTCFIRRCHYLRERMPPRAYHHAAAWMRGLFFATFIVVNVCLLSLKNPPGASASWSFLLAVLGFPVCLIASGIIGRRLCMQSMARSEMCVHCGSAITRRFLPVTLERVVPLDYLQACAACGRLQEEGGIFVAPGRTREVP